MNLSRREEEGGGGAYVCVCVLQILSRHKEERGVGVWRVEVQRDKGEGGVCGRCKGNMRGATHM